MRKKIMQVGTQTSRPRRLVRLGITELTALTWLPRLMSAVRTSGSTDIDIKPEVGLARYLFRELVNGNLDLIVIPEVFSDPAVSSIRLAEVHNAWMASPQLVAKQKTYSLEEFRALTILLQDLDSGSGAYYDRWLKRTGATFESVLSSNSLIALVGLAVAGLGITYLPTLGFSRLVEEGKLMIVPTNPILPPVPYAAMSSNTRKDNTCDEIVLLMEQFATSHRSTSSESASQRRSSDWNCFGLWWFKLPKNQPPSSLRERPLSMKITRIAASLAKPVSRVTRISVIP